MQLRKKTVFNKNKYHLITLEKIKGGKGKMKQQKQERNYANSTSSNNNSIIDISRN